MYICGVSISSAWYKRYHPSSRKYFVSMDVTFFEDHSFFPNGSLQGENTSEETNWGLSLSVLPEPILDISTNESILPTKQVPWITYYRRNLRKEMAPPIISPAPVHESERRSVPGINSPIPDDGNKCDKIDVCVENGESKNREDNDIKDVIEAENDDCETLVPVENIAEPGKEMSPIPAENTVESGKMTEHETYEQEGECSMKSEESKDRDASLDLSIALRKGTRSCKKYPLQSYLSYSNMSLEFKAFTTNLDTVVIPNSIHTALEISEWKAAVMEEMGALNKNHTWDQVTLPNGHKVVGCKWVFTV
ncbi:uncharacterized protein LOC120077687 [Benincasa hispida]|uniref:uncharacterized protein LOC120077687 n=1 Tax=Benincasa hispida TaxID=102211 RepID=UPI0018FFCDB2|nr:uncharacterized protein LOC120077687 [Benincasa hispida]XP_038887575.1 uncharacterized protein LOC120077687 [Benincasa hispida]